MSDTPPVTITALLGEAEAGNRAALQQLFPLVYEELRQLAHHQRRAWTGETTLETTALVHEAYLKLVGAERLSARSRGHFLAIAARAMRFILCDHARASRTARRGGAGPKLSLDALVAGGREIALTDEQSDTLAALDEVLRELEAVEPRLGAVVECRFFGGLTVDDTASAIGVSPATVKRDWAMARAWLFRALHDGGFA